MTSEIAFLKNKKKALLYLGVKAFDFIWKKRNILYKYQKFYFYYLSLGNCLNNMTI